MSTESQGRGTAMSDENLEVVFDSHSPYGTNSANTTLLDEDEALARALQKEYEAEAQHGRISTDQVVVQGRSVPSAPPENQVRRFNPQRKAQEKSDEEYARQLDQELRRSQRFEQVPRRPTPPKRSASRSSSGMSTASRNDPRLERQARRPTPPKRSASRNHSGMSTASRKSDSTDPRFERQPRRPTPPKRSASRSSSGMSAVSRNSSGQNVSRMAALMSKEEAGRLEQKSRREQELRISQNSQYRPAPPRRSASRNLSGMSAASRTSTGSESARPAPPKRSTSRNPSGMSAASRTSTGSESARLAAIKKDEEVARRLQEQLQSEQEMSMFRPPSRTSSSKKTNDTPATSRSNSLGSDLARMAATLDDEELARRMEQELRDEELARNITTQEEQRASSRQSRQIAATPPRQGCSFRRFCCSVLPVVVVAAAIATFLYFYLLKPDALPEWFPDPEDFANEDPFSQQTPGETSRWNNRGQGLELDILNALDQEWYPYFNIAVVEWDEGVPDTLTLHTKTISVDPACSTVPGAIKVCNGNYGETFWRGINKLLLENDSIYASAARMNEFYFGRGDEAQRQYTMCHEIGHGFGLPHTDESFTNRDQGNCMDYTNRPQNNKQPDSTNFEFLAELYGVIPGSAVEGTSVAETEAVPQGGNRSLSRRAMPRRVLRSLEDCDRDIERGLSAINPENGWNLLHRSEFGEAHEKDVGEGFKVQVHLLLA